MIGDPLLDGWRPGCRLETTSARSHPELLIGEFAMRPRPCVQISDADRRAARIWSGWTIGAIAAVVIAVLGIAAINRGHAPAAVLADSLDRSPGLTTQMP